MMPVRRLANGVAERVLGEVRACVTVFDVDLRLREASRPIEEGAFEMRPIEEGAFEMRLMEDGADEMRPHEASTFEMRVTVFGAQPRLVSS
jgi:hypothetical protein